MKLSNNFFCAFAQLISIEHKLVSSRRSLRCVALCIYIFIYILINCFQRAQYFRDWSWTAWNRFDRVVNLSSYLLVKVCDSSRMLMLNNQSYDMNFMHDVFNLRIHRRKNRYLRAQTAQQAALALQHGLLLRADTGSGRPFCQGIQLYSSKFF